MCDKSQQYPERGIGQRSKAKGKKIKHRNDGRLKDRNAEYRRQEGKSERIQTPRMMECGESGNC